MTTRILHGIEIFEKTLKEDHPRIIPVKFGEILRNSLGGVVV